MLVKYLKILIIACAQKEVSSARISTHKQSVNSNATVSYSCWKVFHNPCEMHDLSVLFTF